MIIIIIIYLEKKENLVNFIFNNIKNPNQIIQKENE